MQTTVTLRAVFCGVDVQLQEPLQLLAQLVEAAVEG